MKSGNRTATIMAVMGFMGAPVGNQIGEIKVQSVRETRADARRCIVESGRLATGGHITDVCQQFMRGSDPELGPMPTSTDISNDFLKSPVSEDEIIYEWTGIGIFLGLGSGCLLGAGLTKFMPKIREYLDQQ